MWKKLQTRCVRSTQSLCVLFISAIALGLVAAGLLHRLGSLTGLLAAVVGFSTAGLFLAGAMAARGLRGTGDEPYLGIADLPIGCALLDEQMQVLWLNRAARNLLGIDAEEQPLCSWKDLMASPDAENQHEAWPEEGVHWKGPGLDGHRIPLHYQIMPLNGRHGVDSRARFLLVMRNVDPLFAEFREETEASRLRTAACFASQIAHEVRNPVAAICGSAQLIGLLSEKARRGDERSLTLLAHEQDALCRSIVEQSMRLDRILAQFLSFSDLSQESLRAVIEMPTPEAKRSEAVFSAPV